MAERQFNKGEVIFREGEEGKSFFEILNGSVAIIASYGEPGETRLAKLTKNQFFGEMAVIEGYPRGATAVSLEDGVRVNEIEASLINEFFEKDTDRILEIMKHIGNRLRELSDDYTEINDVIKKLNIDSGKRGCPIDKIRKYATVYKHNRKMADKKVEDPTPAYIGGSHSEGFSVDTEEVAKGSVIFREGENSRCMYDIHSGKVGIFRRYGTPDEEKYAELVNDNFFGEIGMLEDKPRSATAVALEDSVIEVIYPEDMIELFKKNPPKLNMIFIHLSYRLRKLTNDYIRACKLLYKVEAAGGSPSEELKREIREYRS